MKCHVSETEIEEIVTSIAKTFFINTKGIIRIVSDIIHRLSMVKELNLLPFRPEKLMFPGEFTEVSVRKENCVKCDCLVKRMNACMYVAWKQIKELHDKRELSNEQDDNQPRGNDSSQSL